MRPKYDILWKGLIEEVMEDLLLFVEPGIGGELDLDRGFVFLDKELAEIYPEPDQPAKTRVVDKLVKAFLRDGTERWMMFHLEVEGGNNKDFPSRMFNYFIRVFSKYGRPVAAIAVLTGKYGANMPGAYEDRCLWMRARYEYKTLALTDYPDEVLEESTNPFAIVLLVAKETLLQVEGDEEERDSVLLDQKLRIVRLLKERMAVFGERKTRAILVFLKNYVVFKKPETNLIFMEQTDQLLGKSKTMGIFEQLAEIKHQEGIQEGLELAVRGLLTNSEYSTGKIAELMGVPIDLVEKVKKEMN
jgi:hypothetical protein